MRLWLLWFGILTLVLRPWRGSFSQDDSVYFKFSQSLSQLDFKVHVLNVAGVWPQALIGALMLKLPGGEIPILNSLTWTIFGGLSLVLAFRHRTQALLVLSFFSFPIFLQYGISFLPDIYLSLILYFCFRWFSKEHPRWQIFPLAILLVTQYQTSAAFLLFWSLDLLYRRDRRAWWAMGALVLALAVYVLLPKSELQKLGMGMYFDRYQALTADSILAMAAKFLQLMVSVGIFLIPLLPSRPNRRLLLRTFLAQVLVFAAIYFSTDDIVSAGVLFTNYFPKILGCFFVTLGVWGWAGLLHAWRFPGLGISSLLACFTIAAFDSFRVVQDIRYVIPLSLVWFLLWMDDNEYAEERIGHSTIYLVPVVLVGLLVNSYNLQTTETRWLAASRLIEGGIDPKSISAGYGWDLVNYEPECTERALAKVRALDPAEQAIQLKENILTKAPRIMEQGALPKFLIKPHTLFGKKLNLSRNTRPGQDNEPQEIYKYSVLGLPNAVAVIDTGFNQPPSCLN